MAEQAMSRWLRHVDINGAMLRTGLTVAARLASDNRPAWASARECPPTDHPITLCLDDRA
jgi:hypothetical protein